MLLCKICGRQTLLGEPTGSLITYRKKTYIDGCDGKEAMSEIKCCVRCGGETKKIIEKEIEKKTDKEAK